MIMAELFSMHNLKEKATPKSVHFLVITDKKFILMLSYLSKFQLLKCILSKEICLQRSWYRQPPGRARLLSVMSSCSRDFVLASVFVYSRSWLIFNLTVLDQNMFLILRIAKAKTKK